MMFQSTSIDIVNIVLVAGLLISLYIVAVGVVSFVTSCSLRESHKKIISFLFPAKGHDIKQLPAMFDDFFVYKFEEIVMKHSELKSRIFYRKEVTKENGLRGFEFEFFGTPRSADNCMREVRQLVAEYFYPQGFAVYVYGEILHIQDNKYIIRIFYALNDGIPLLRMYENRQMQLRVNNERKEAEEKMKKTRDMGVIKLGKDNDATQQR